MPDRRTFLRTIVGGIATAAAVRSFPFRVYSFPSKILTPEEVNAQAILYFKKQMDLAFSNPLYRINVCSLDLMTGAWLGLSRASYPGKLSAQISTE